MYKTWKIWRKIGNQTLISQSVKRISTTVDLYKRNNSIDIDDLFSDQDVTAGIQTLPKRNNLGDSNFVPFEDFINQRRNEAKCSVLVQVKSQESVDDLVQYCQTNFGNPKSLHFHHNEMNENFKSFFLVEFDNEDVVKEILTKHAKHRWDIKDQFPVCSPILWLSNSSDDLPNREKSSHDIPIFLPQDNKAINCNTALEELLDGYETLDDQIMAMFNACKMTSMSERLRFMICEQVESTVRGLFPYTKVLPFGSSVNSFGKSNADLDMCITHREYLEDKSNSRFVFHAKGSTLKAGTDFKTVLQYISFSLKTFVPGCQNVENIFHARVPIIKFEQDFMNIDCDLSANSSGYHMSNLLYIWGHLDWRVRPLVFAIRKWAYEQDLIGQSRPTQLFTNFPLTLLVIFYLQYKHQILPPFKQLKLLADPSDKIITEDGLDCTFIRNVVGYEHALNKSKIDPKIADLSLSELLMGFFDFYAQFEFSRKTICVESGRLIPKRIKNGPLTLDVINPLDPKKNTAVNIYGHCIEKFKRCCKKTCEKINRENQDKNGHVVLPLTYLFSPRQLKVPKSGELLNYGYDASKNGSAGKNKNHTNTFSKTKRRLQVPTSGELFDDNDILEVKGSYKRSK